MKSINIIKKLDQIHDHWNPRIVAELNGQQVRLVKAQGEFPFHKHEHEDEMFFVVKGQVKIEFEDHSEIISENEFLVVPAGTLHRPVAEKEVHLMMFVTAQNVNTGNLKDHAKKKDSNKLERI